MMKPTVKVTDINNCINYDTVFLRLIKCLMMLGKILTICGSTSITLGGNPTSPFGSNFLWTSTHYFQYLQSNSSTYSAILVYCGDF